MRELQELGTYEKELKGPAKGLGFILRHSLNLPSEQMDVLNKSIENLYLHMTNPKTSRDNQGNLLLMLEVCEQCLSMTLSIEAGNDLPF